MSQFSQYTRSTAFSITMSQEAITQLLDIEVFSRGTTYPDPPFREFCKKEYGVHLLSLKISGYLQRRGLIEPATAQGCQDNWMLTKAGELLCPLLREAGFQAKYELVSEPSGRRYVQLASLRN